VLERIQVSNSVGAELASGAEETLRKLEERLDCSVYLRGNTVTIEGESEKVAIAQKVIGELVEVAERGHAITPDHVEVVGEAIDASSSGSELLTDVLWQSAHQKIMPKTVNQKRYVDSIRSNTVTFGIGPAGTGKTFLAVALAAKALKDGDVRRIILTRPAVEAGERLGFLPGDMMAKIDPYLKPLFDALNDTLGAERVAEEMERGVIEVAPLAFMRGRTLNGSFIILDEAQNTSAQQMKMILTRLGFGSKMVVTGDVTQIDLPPKQRSGLVAVREILQGVDDIGFTNFTERDVVRHKLVQQIVKAYERHHVVHQRSKESSSS